jgi:hypothetical protein
MFDKTLRAEMEFPGLEGRDGSRRTMSLSPRGD